MNKDATPAPDSEYQKIFYMTFFYEKQQKDARCKRRSTTDIEFSGQLCVKAHVHQFVPPPKKTAQKQARG